VNINISFTVDTKLNIIILNICAHFMTKYTFLSLQNF